MKLYVRKGNKPAFRPTLRIRDTGFCRNQRLEKFKHGEDNPQYCSAGWSGGHPVSQTTVEEQIRDYFEFLGRLELKPEWRVE